MHKLLIVIYSLLFVDFILPYSTVQVVTDTLQVESINFSKSTIDSTAWINIDYPQIVNSENDSVITKINLFLEQEFKQSIEWYDEIISDTTEIEDTSFKFQYSFETGFQVVYNSRDFISIVLDHYQYTGGAHGNYVAFGYNIRLEDGAFITLKDIVEESALDLLTFECEESILEKYEANSLMEAGLFENEIVLTYDQDFYIIPGALVLQFDPYEIGPFAMGEITAEIQFEKINDILKQDLPFSTE
ncbi:MAG: DUF3298 and DUF4163 domain-containing protein [Ignavibacteriales bacterium]|nr:DUF3298 and DUF4163 domain-containing protein [Ignavibacteriales bacterium]